VFIGWSGESVKIINAKLKESGFNIVDEGLKVMWNPDNESMASCFELG
jgi:flavorubredoxin